VTPEQAQEVISRAWEAGYFQPEIGDHIGGCYHGHGCRLEKMAKKEAFRLLVGFWPDEQLVEWGSSTERPRLRTGAQLPDEFWRPSPSEAKESLPKLSSRLWDVFLRGLGWPVVDWTLA